MRDEVVREWVTYRPKGISGLSRTTLWRLVRAGEVEAAKAGRAVRINRKSLDAYVRRSAVGSGAGAA